MQTDHLPLFEIIQISRAIAMQQGDDHILESCDEVECDLHRLEHLYLNVPCAVRHD